MSVGITIGLVLLGLLVLPVLSYMVVKFGAAGYFRAKRREINKQKQKETNNE